MRRSPLKTTRLTLAGPIELVSSETQIPNKEGRTVQNQRLQIPGKSDDVRARRAREQISWALIELIHLKDYGAITVQDIAERAGVSRTTFYAHFQDRDDIMVRSNVTFGQHWGSLLTWDESSGQYRFPATKLFEHVRASRGLYDALTRARRMEDLIRIIRINMAEGFEQHITAHRRDSDEIPPAMMAHHLAATLTGLLVWWMERHCPIEPPAMDEHFHRLIAELR
jgi:AcrR family transcriptional regulator